MAFAIMAAQKYESKAPDAVTVGKMSNEVLYKGMIMQAVHSVQVVGNHADNV